MSAIESPDVRQEKVGVRRPNRLPLVIAFSIVMVVVAGVGYTLMDRTANDARETRRAEQKKPDPVSPDSLFTNAPVAGLIASAPPPSSEAPTPTERRTQGGPGESAIPNDGEHFKREWEQYRQQEAAIRQAKVQAAITALTASTSVQAAARPAVAAGQGTTGVPSSTLESGNDTLAGMREGLTSMLAKASGSPGGEADANNAQGKVSWLKGAASPANYLATGRAAAVSPYELKAGAVIPGVMVGGINSDLPGQILGQVRENVYDSATGSHLLIPQGAKLIGTYDSQVTRGQSRVLVAWNRIIYPDGSSVDIEGMPGSDQSGYSGFADKVDNHYRRVFGDALLMSLFAAGVQLSQPQTSSLNGAGYDSQQVVAGALGQQLGQTGMQLTQQNLRIQPTLKIRPGYRFNVMVTKDMIVEPWRTP